ncbi:hypothetical protein O1611_g9526 [Lasiodiplodia mahajangana]|uniref:Uncharacterized protein n=1 Tax=Lasiodiplodia mahajangana TaxID=1108764 RepID=A0ACC2J8R2_9PEZI|nr:hypothetical protein O1611_g9526 [Lasiodiplodia mahajangana]
MAGSLRAIALLCYMSIATAEKPYRGHQYMNYRRQFSFSNSSSLTPTSFSSTPLSSSSSISSTSSFSIPSSSSSSISPSSSPGSSSTTSSVGSSSVPTITSTQGTTTSTTPVIITVDWTTISASTTTSVASATHNSNGWPIIPIHHCWFCLPGGNDGGGIVIAGVTGPGIIPPPPPNVASSLGFSSNIPSITLDAEGDPSYPSTEPTMSPSPSQSPSSSPSPTTMSTMSTTTRSSSSSECTSTTTGYDYYVTCTATVTDPLLLTTSTGCVTSTVTTTGCDITSTASTTTVAACPASVFRSVSSAEDAQAASAITVVSGTTIPLAFYVDDTATPADFTVSYFGSIFASNSTSSAPTPTPTTSISSISTSESPSPSSSDISSPSTSAISSSSGSDTPTSSSATTATTLNSPIPTTSSSDTSDTSQPSTSPTSSTPISTTSAAPTPTATWYLTAYDADCDSLKSSSDFSYYTLQGYSVQSPDEQCSNIQSGLPLNSDTSDSCDWFTNGGFDGPHDCSEGTFTKPKSFVIRSGFCTIYEDTDCNGGMNGVTSTEYSGCTNVDDAFVNFNWNSISCFAINMSD